MERARKSFVEFFGRLNASTDWLWTFLTYGDVVREEEEEEKLKNVRGQSSVPDVHRKKYNGLIASVDALVVLATVALTVSMTPYLAADHQRVTNRVPEEVLLLFMLVGLAILFLFARRNDAFIGRNLPQRRVQSCRNVDRILLMVGLVLFYTLSFVLDLFHCIAQFDCAREWTDKNNGGLVLDYVVDILFHLVRTTYLGCSTLFVVIYGHVIPANKCWVRYGLVVLFGCNLAVWFDVLLHESVPSSQETNVTYPSHLPGLNCTSGTAGNYGNKTVDCLCFTTKFFKRLREYISPVCYPFMYECSVLLGERFMHWFSSCSAQSSDAKRINSQKKQLKKSSTADAGIETPHQWILQSIEEEEEEEESVRESIVSATRLQDSASPPPNDAHDSSTSDICDSDFCDSDICDSSVISEDIYDPYCSDDLSPEEETLPVDPERRPGSDGNLVALTDGEGTVAVFRGQIFRNGPTATRGWTGERVEAAAASTEGSCEEPPLQDKPASMVMYTVFFLVTISTNVLFFLLALLPSLLHQNDEHRDVSRYYLYYSGAYYCFASAVAFAGFVVARHFPLRRSRSVFQGLDYLLLISACGPFAFNTLSLVAILFKPSVLTDRGLDLGSQLLLQFSNMIEVGVQIPFCFFAGRVTAMNSNGTSRPGAKYFQAVIVYASVSNATLWLVNSFTTVSNGKIVYYSRDFFAGVQDLISSFVLPVTLFFRFNSSLLLLKALRTAFKKPDRSRNVVDR